MRRIIANTLIIGALTSCSHSVPHKEKNKERAIASLVNNLGNEVGNRIGDDVSSYLRTMKMIGGDGATTFASPWKKKTTWTSYSKQIEEVQEIFKQYETNIDSKILEQKIIIEEKEICEKWDTYKIEEKKINTTNFHKQSNLILSTSAAASALGLIGFGNSYGGTALGMNAEIKAGFDFSSNSTKNTVDYYYARQGLKCAQLNIYQRAVFTITPDIQTLHPQQTATLIYNRLDAQIENFSNQVSKLHEAFGFLIENPIISKDKLGEKLSSFYAVQLIKNKQVTTEVGLDMLAFDLQEMLSSTKTKLNQFKNNSIVQQYFQEQIILNETLFNEIIDNLASLEKKIFLIKVGSKTKLLLNENKINLLNGHPSNTSIKNASIISQDALSSLELKIFNLFDKRKLVVQETMANCDIYEIDNVPQGIERVIFDELNFQAKHGYAPKCDNDMIALFFTWYDENYQAERKSYYYILSPSAELKKALKRVAQIKKEESLD